MTKHIKRVMYLLIVLVVVNSQVCLCEVGNRLYNEGMKAYQKGDYIKAIEFLFAFLQMNKGKLDPEFEKTLKRALHYSEQQIHQCIEQKRNQQTHIKVDAVMMKIPIKLNKKMIEKKKNKQ